MAETLKLPSSTRFSRSADRSNTQGSAMLAVEQGNRMSLSGHFHILTLMRIKRAAYASLAMLSSREP